MRFFNTGKYKKIFVCVELAERYRTLQADDLKNEPVKTTKPRLTFEQCLLIYFDEMAMAGHANNSLQVVCIGLLGLFKNKHLWLSFHIIASILNSSYSYL